MRFPPSFLEEIRNRLPVSQVVGKRVKLKRQGREQSGLCPFHQEKSPSFTVSDSKAFFHCFGCGEHGDVFDWVCKTEGLDFPDAVARLAEEAGMPMPKPDPESVKREARRLSLMELTEKAADHYRRQLEGPAGRHVREYLGSRGVTAADAERFRIGFASDDKFGVKTALLKEGAQEADLVEAGLLITAEDVLTPYDRFRNRVMFPVCDDRGRVVSFGGRALDPDAHAKYLNGPETAIFHKGSVLYNGHAARKAAHDAETPAVLVEGYLDVVSAVRAGFQGTAAPMGTAMTPDQCRLLWRMNDEPVICYDGDAAGVRAAYKSISVVMPLLVPGRSVRFCLLPEGQDPDDIIRHRGPAAFENAIAMSVSLVDLLWRRETAGKTLGTPERRAALEHAIVEATEVIADPTLKREYRSDLRDRIRSLSQRPALRRSNGHSLHSTAPGALRLVFGYERSAGLSLRDASIVVAMMAAPSEAMDSAEAIAAGNSMSAEGQNVAMSILDVLAGMPDIEPEALLQRLGDSAVSASIDQAVALCRSAGLSAIEPGGDVKAATAVLRSALTGH